VSWGKIRIDAKPVKVCCDATLIFPLIVSQTFYKAYQANLRKEEEKKSADTSL
jgi:deoxyhypusine synthase